MQVPSKFLYAQFYTGKEQKRINTKTNDAEEAYRILLDNRRRVNEGERVLPSEASKLKYEDLIEKLMDYYRTDHPTSLRTQKTEDGGKEATFDGKDNLDEFFGHDGDRDHRDQSSGVHQEIFEDGVPGCDHSPSVVAPEVSFRACSQSRPDYSKPHS